MTLTPLAPAPSAALPIPSPRTPTESSPNRLVSQQAVLAAMSGKPVDATKPVRVLFEVFEPCDGTYIGFSTVQTAADVAAGLGTDTTVKPMVFLPEAQAEANALGVTLQITMNLPSPFPVAMAV